jgi:hypothetical protein
MPPTQFANQASVTITTQQAQTILQNMGVSLPGNVASPGAISQILQETPPMSQAQIEEFITQAQGLTSGAAK